MGKNKKEKKPMTLATKSALTGYGFISLWLIGFCLIFFMPLLSSLIYSFSEVKINPGNISTKFIGLDNFNYLFFENPDYGKNLLNSFGTMLYEVPIISIFSMFIAGILNQKFKGRTVARVLFFLPVIIASGATIQILKQGGMSTDMSSTVDTVYLFKSTALKDILMDAGFNSNIVSFLTDLINKIFDITWKSGIQILLYLSGLQTVPKSYFEVSSMEGATAWEEFWKITFPMLMPITLVCVIYTIIDSFTYYENPVMRQIKAEFDKLAYGHATAMSWVFCLIIFVIVIVVTKTIFKNASED